MISFYVALSAGRLLARLPLSFLHGLSNVIAWLMQHLWHYRDPVIRENIRRSFPEISSRERAQIQRKFYQNFADIIVESIKSLHLSEKQMRRRLVIRNPEVFQELHQQGRGVITVMGHNANFEWVAMGLPLCVPQDCFAVYHPLKNRGLNKEVVKLREQFGLQLFRMKNTYPFMLDNPTPAPLYLFMADQSPHRGKIKYRLPFLNQDTPVHMGVENLARKCDLAVVFIDILRVKRGHYEIVARPLYESVQDAPQYEVTHKHVAALEELIRQDPPNWLWSHKRWKHA